MGSTAVEKRPAISYVCGKYSGGVAASDIFRLWEVQRCRSGERYLTFVGSTAVGWRLAISSVCGKYSGEEAASDILRLWEVQRWGGSQREQNVADAVDDRNVEDGPERKIKAYLDKSAKWICFLSLITKN